MKSKTKKTVSPKRLKRGFAVLDREKARKDAPVAIRALRRIIAKARADLSVSMVICKRLDHALDLVEEELNELLPPPGSRPEARLPFDEQGQPLCAAEPIKAKIGAVGTAPLPDINRWDELTDEEKDALIDHYAKPCED